MTTAEAILTDLLADESDWWAAELQTVTGFFRSEYEALAERMCKPDYSLTDYDRRVLYGAGMGLVYCDPPYLPAEKVKSLFGEDWQSYVEDFIQVIDGKK